MSITTIQKKIKSVQDFEAYVRSRGLVPFIIAERPDDGYYAEVRRGTPKVDHFTQIKLSACHWLKGQAPFQDSSKYEWVRLSFKDCDNINIIQSI